MEKSELLQKMSQSRGEFEAVIAQFSDEQMLRPVLPGGWTVKDALAHIAWWARRAQQVASVVVNAGEPEYSLEESDVDGINLRAYQENALRPLSDVRSEEAEAYRALRALTESLDDDDLSDSSRFAWTKGLPLSVVVEWNTFGHYEEHLPDLRKALGK